jgi:TPR repeat protein
MPMCLEGVTRAIGHVAVCAAAWALAVSSAASRDLDATRRDCDAGRAADCQELGRRYESGEGVAADLSRAIELYERACKAGSAAGCWSSGMHHHYGSGVPKDPARAAVFYEKACDGGDSVGCAHLARLYETGSGVAADAERARTLYRRGCGGGDTASLCLLYGMDYAEGEGLPEDVPFAAALYRESCEGGQAVACGRLGWLYEGGSGVGKDLIRAAALYQRACDGADAMPCSLLGHLYELGSGVALDTGRALALYQRACDAKDMLGCGALADMYARGTGVPRDEQRAAAFYQRACDAGSSHACIEVASHHPEEAEGLQADEGVAATDQKACDAGDAAGCYRLASHYAKGSSTAKDPPRAAVLFRRACDGGYQPACDQVETWRFRELDLVAIMPQEGGRRAYLAGAGGGLWPVETAQRLLDGEIEEIGTETVTFQADQGAQEVRHLFQNDPPAPWIADAEHTGALVSVNLNGDIRTLVQLTADMSGLNLILQAGSTGRIRMVGRDTPWDALFDRALTEGGFGHRVVDLVVLVGPKDRLEGLSIPSFPRSSQPLIDVTVRDADVRDLARVFASISGRRVTLPDRPCSVTLSFNEVPWDTAFGWIATACGFSFQIDEDALKAEAPTH